MADKTKIEWTDSSWNPLRGCSRVSEGCRHCYAEGVAARFSGLGLPYEGLAKRMGGEPRWTGEVRFVEAHLTDPLRWRNPRRIFVNSMSDLFHEKVPDEWIDRIFAVMALSPQHTFQVLTKRPERMRAWFAERWQPAPAQRIAFGGGDAINVPAESEGANRHSIVDEACEEFISQFHFADTENDALWTTDGSLKIRQFKWPLPNVWLGVSAEDQATADERIPILLDTPAAVRFVSAEPLLGPVDLRFIDHHARRYDALRGRSGRIARHENGDVSEYDWNPQGTQAHLDWIIVGGESGPKARPMHPAWARSLRDQCTAAGVAYFFKQWGAWVPHKVVPGDDLGRDMRAGIVDLVHRESHEPAELLARSIFPGDCYMARVGKHDAGRILDGRTWDQFPEART